MLSGSHHNFLLISFLAVYILPYLKRMHFAAEIAILCMCVHVHARVCAVLLMQQGRAGHNCSRNFNCSIAL